MEPRPSQARFAEQAVPRHATNLYEGQPLFALNGGINISQDLLVRLPQGVQTFVQSRALPIPSGEMFAITKPSPTLSSLGSVRRHFSDEQSYSAVGPRYYETNNGTSSTEMGTEPLSITQRSQLFAQHLREDAALFSPDATGLSPIEQLQQIPGTDGIRANLAVMQMLINDASGIVYALRLAEALGYQLAPQHQQALQQALNLETVYYTTLLHTIEPHSIPTPPHFPIEQTQIFFQQATDTLTEMDNFFASHRFRDGQVIKTDTAIGGPQNLGDEIDYIRNRREVEGLAVMEAAMIIADEIRERRMPNRQDVVLIGGLGPMAMKAALRVAFAVHGLSDEVPIRYTVPDVKLIGIDGRRHTQALPLSNQFITSINDLRSRGALAIHNVDDSGGTLRTLDRFLQRQQANFGPECIQDAYIVQGNDRGIDDSVPDHPTPVNLPLAIETIKEKLGITVHILFRAPLVRNNARGDMANFERATTVRWERQRR